MCHARDGAWQYLLWFMIYCGNHYNESPDLFPRKLARRVVPFTASFVVELLAKAWMSCRSSE